MPGTYHVVIAFERDAEGDLKPNEAQEVMTSNRGRTPGSRGRAGTYGRFGFSRTGDPETGEFQDAVILARFGEVDLGSLGE